MVDNNKALGIEPWTDYNCGALPKVGNDFIYKLK